MKTVSYLAGVSLLVTGAASLAQDITEPAPPVDGAPTEIEGPSADPMVEPAPTAPTTEPLTETPPAASTADPIAEPAPATPAEETIPEGSLKFTDADIDGFAQSMSKINALQENGSMDSAAIQAEAPTILADAGIDVETFNAIGTAMQTDPELAQRVQLAMSSQQGNPGA